MKKAFGWLLALALVASIGTAFAEDAQDYLGISHYGIVYFANFEDTVEFLGDDFGALPEDLSRIVSVSTMTAPVSWVELPAGDLTAEDYQGKGVRFVLDEGSFAENVNIARPVELEIIGDVARGIVLELDDSHILIETLDGGEDALFAITADTYVHETLDIGKTCEVVFDGENAIYIMESNG